MLSEMWSDILLQAFLILASLFAFLFIYNVPQNLFSKLRRSRSLAEFQAKRHFVKGATILNQARSKHENLPLAKSAVIEADKAISLDPKDAAFYLLKAVALEVLGFKTSALDALDLALGRGVDEEERGSALFKRAELRMEISPRAVGEVVGDLVESVGLKGDNVRAFLLLGRCYEKMGLEEKAKKAYEDALLVQPGLDSAQKALDRLVDC